MSVLVDVGDVSVPDGVDDSSVLVSVAVPVDELDEESDPEDVEDDEAVEVDVLESVVESESDDDVELLLELEELEEEDDVVSESAQTLLVLGTVSKFLLFQSFSWLTKSYCVFSLLKHRQAVRKQTERSQGCTCYQYIFHTDETDTHE